MSPQFKTEYAPSKCNDCWCLKKKRKILKTGVDMIVFPLCKFKNLENTVINVGLLHFASMVSCATVPYLQIKTPQSL